VISRLAAGFGSIEREFIFNRNGLDGSTVEMIVATLDERPPELQAFPRGPKRRQWAKLDTQRISGLETVRNVWPTKKIVDRFEPAAAPNRLNRSAKRSTDSSPFRRAR
jgi:hypothetical protein